MMRSRCRKLLTRPGKLHAFAVLLVAGVCLGGCSRPRTEYPASTPDEAIDSAQTMIVNGEADRLTDLIYAEDEATRSFLNQVGSMLGSLQRLGQAVEQRFPEELGAFRAEAEKAAAEGRTNPILARLVASRGGGRNRSFGVSRINREGLTLDNAGDGDARPARPGDLFTGRQSESQRELVNGIIKQLLADPYRWLADGRDRLDHVYISDDTVSLTWDDKPILPPFGLSLIEREGRWFLVPPTSYPGVRMVLPRNADEWFVWGSMVKTLERVVVDLERDVRTGQVRNMTDLADSAAEKVAIPAMLVFFAYGNMVEQRQAEMEAARDASRSGEATEAEPGETPPGETAPEGADEPDAPRP